MEQAKWQRRFCGTYLGTMDPQRAAEAAGREDGFATLGLKSIRRRLERMRSAAAGELRREDACGGWPSWPSARSTTRRGWPWTPRGGPGEAGPLRRGGAEGDGPGGVEVKLVDRTRALETLCGLLGDGGGGAEELYRALEDAAGQMEDGPYGG